MQENSVGGARGGMRQVTANLLQEKDLVVLPARRRLAVPVHFRDTCQRKHRGFCRTRDAAISQRVMCCMAHLRVLESPSSAGVTALRFFADTGQADRGRLADVHVTFASLRQNPKYTAMYIQGEVAETRRETEFPFHVTDMVFAQAQLPHPAPPDVTVDASLALLRSWELAVLLCERFEAGSVVMEQLQHTVTTQPKTIVVTGALRIVDDIMEPPAEDPTQRVRARQMRGLAALDPSTGGSSSGLAPHCRGGGNASGTGAGGGAGASEVGAVDAAEQDPWWVPSLMQSLASQRQRQRTDGLDTGEGDRDSGSENNEWYTKKV
jgi:hypothetical protein